MPDVVITEFMENRSVEELSRDYDVLYDTALADDTVRLREVAAEARALVVRNRTVVDAALLDSAPRLLVVARLGVGLDNIAVEECALRDIEVSPAVGANAVAVAEYVIGALLVLFRGVFGLTGQVARGEWPRHIAIGREVTGRRLGLVGYGLIAREVAARASALGMGVSAFDPYVSDTDASWDVVGRAGSLEDLMGSSEAVSIHVPLSAGTKGLIDSAMIGRMPEGAVLVNTARGGIVDESAVVAALNDGRLGGAALDVFGSEPLAADDGSRFTDAPNLVLTPHIAGITKESETRTAAMTAAAVRRALSG